MATMQQVREHPDAAPNPVVLIRSILPSLPPAERRVADGVLAQPADIVSLGIKALAERSATSEATVVRFCKRAGFAGYPDLRLALATQVGRSAADGKPTHILTDVVPDDSLAEIVAKVGALDAQAVTDTVGQLDVERLKQVVEAIAGARRIELYGIGASGLVAIDLEQKLRRIGRPAVASVDGHAAMTSAAVLTSDDVAIGISHSGETLDVIDPIALARARDCITVAITNFARSSLAQVAHIVLTTAARESLFRAGAMASRSAQLTVIDCVYLAVAQRDHVSTMAALDQTSSAVRSRRRNA